MLCIHSKSRDPYYNLATEEYLLKHSTEEVFLLWQSTPVVIVGKHQNTLAEINYKFIRSNDIQIARRLTGGGAVYHDQGNINFSFIRCGQPGKLVDFAGFIEPVMNFLKTIHIEATRGLKNEILVNGKKVSGNAEHVYKNRVLHHGTLLFSAELGNLSESIRQEGGNYTDKAVKSNRSSVLNLAGCINPAMRMEEFIGAFFSYMKQNFNGRLSEPGRNEKTGIQQLAKDKYSTWEWIYGWSPDYEFENLSRNGNQEIAIKLKVHRGIIVGCTLKSQVIPPEMAAIVGDKLTGVFHEESIIRNILEEAGFRSIFDNGELTNLVLAFF